MWNVAIKIQKIFWLKKIQQLVNEKKWKLVINEMAFDFNYLVLFLPKGLTIYNLYKKVYKQDQGFQSSRLSKSTEGEMAKNAIFQREIEKAKLV